MTLSGLSVKRTMQGVVRNQDENTGRLTCQHSHSSGGARHANLTRTPEELSRELSGGKRMPGDYNTMSTCYWLESQRLSRRDGFRAGSGKKSGPPMKSTKGCPGLKYSHCKGWRVESEVFLGFMCRVEGLKCVNGIGNSWSVGLYSWCMES